MKPIYVSALICLILSQFFIGPRSHAAISESLGRIEVTEILVKPFFELREPQEGEFRLGDSAFEFTWIFDRRFRSVVRVGSRALRNEMAHFQDSVDEELSIVEAYGQFNSVYGELRYGMIPIEYGVEGAWSERQLFFPRHLFFARRFLPLRDLGAMYRVRHNGYFSSFSAFNGEGMDSNPDGRMWYAGKWGWEEENGNLLLGVSGLTGTTKPESTSGVADPLASVNVNKEAQWRMGTFFARGFLSKKLSALTEVTFGEVVQDDEVAGKFSGGHFDLVYDTDSWSGMVRYDYLEPDSNTDLDIIREVSLGVIFKNAEQTSWVKIIGTKSYEESSQIPNDRLRIVWQLTPRI